MFDKWSSIICSRKVGSQTHWSLQHPPRVQIAAWLVSAHLWQSQYRTWALVSPSAYPQSLLAFLSVYPHPRQSPSLPATRFIPLAFVGSVVCGGRWVWGFLSCPWTVPPWLQAAEWHSRVQLWWPSYALPRTALVPSEAFSPSSPKLLPSLPPCRL